MTRQTKLKIIRMILWIGVAADALWAAALACPPLFEFLTGRSLEFSIQTLQLVMGLAASLMAGWTLLLIWVIKDPIQRRAVILVTAVPVVAGILGVNVFAMMNGGVAGWILFKVVILEVAMLWSYYLACSVAKGGIHENHA